MARLKSGSRFVDCLADHEQEGLMAACERVRLSHAQALYSQDAPVHSVYFPVTSVCSTVVKLSDGSVIEVGTVGNEGVLGFGAFLTNEMALYTAIAKIEGDAYRLPVEAFNRWHQQCPMFDCLLRRYVAFSLRTVSQTCACCARHSVEERACRWLLTTQDRVGSDEFPLTHEFLAEMLGIHRQTLSIVAATLQRAGFIHYRRGTVRILEREALEEASCECYGVMANLYQRLLRCPGAGRDLSRFA